MTEDSQTSRSFRRYLAAACIFSCLFIYILSFCVIGCIIIFYNGVVFLLVTYTVLKLYWLYSDCNDRPLPPDNAFLVGDDQTKDDAGTYPVGSIATYQCDSNSVDQTTATVVCMDNGAWEVLDLTCTRGRWNRNLASLFSWLQYSDVINMCQWLRTLLYDHTYSEPERKQKIKSFFAANAIS